MVYEKREYNSLLRGTDCDNTDYDAIIKDGIITKIIEIINDVPPIKGASIVNSYIWLQAMSFDEYPFIGEVPNIKRFHVVWGVSGDSFIHLPGVGKIMADIVKKCYTDVMDVSPFSPERVFFYVNFNK